VIEQRLTLSYFVEIVNRYFIPGVFMAKIGDQVKHHGCVNHERAVTEVQYAFRSILRLTRLGHRLLGVLQSLPGFPEEYRTSGGEPNSAGRTVKELHPDLPLQVGDLLGKRRLSDSQAPGGLEKTPFFSDGDEVAKMS
jgi:hypothetical protein